MQPKGLLRGFSNTTVQKRQFFGAQSNIIVQLSHLTSLMAQTVKRLPTMWKTRVQSLDQEDPLEKEMAAHSSILTRRISMDRGAWQATVHGVAKSRTRLNDFTF